MKRTHVATVEVKNPGAPMTAKIFWVVLADGFSAYTVDDSLNGNGTRQAAENEAIDKLMSVYAPSYIYRQKMKIKITTV